MQFESTKETTMKFTKFVSQKTTESDIKKIKELFLTIS